MFENFSCNQLEARLKECKTHLPIFQEWLDFTLDLYRDGIADENNVKTSISLVSHCERSIAVIETRMNPYHDELGRFCSGDGSVIANLKKSLTDLKKQYIKASYTTIDGVKQGAPMTHEQADSGNVNPGIETAIRDTVEGDKFYYNCQTCVLAYEARLRGYDVEARPLDTEEALNLGCDLCRAWLDSNGNTITKMDSIGTHTTAESVYNYLDNIVGASERYIFNYARSDSINKHVINMYRDSYGNLTLKDNQSKRKFVSLWNNKQSIVNYISNYVNKDMYFNAYEITILRVDNLEINLSCANQVLKAKKGNA